MRPFYHCQERQLVHDCKYTHSVDTAVPIVLPAAVSANSRTALLVVQVFASRGHLAACALACAYACDLPFMWAPLLAIVQAGTAALEGFQTLEQAQQHLADDLHKVCPAPAPVSALPLLCPAPALPCPCPALPLPCPVIALAVWCSEITGRHKCSSSLRVCYV